MTPEKSLEEGDAPEPFPPPALDGNDGVLSSARKMPRRVMRDKSLRAALFPFVLTRVLLLAILLVGGQINHIATGGEPTREINLSLRQIPVARILRETVQTADVNWYRGIAENGYEKIPFNTDAPHNWAFFPLFPLVWRLASNVTGEFVLIGMALSHIFFLLALVLVHKTALAFNFDRRVADRSIFYLAVFPTSFFFSLPLTESLFLMLTVGSLYGAKRGRWWTACALAALASATRVTGVLLLPALAALYWQTYGRAWRRGEVLSLGVAPLGLLSFMGYLYTITGDPLAFKHILVTWGRSTGLFLIPLFEYLQRPLLVAVPWDFRLINFAAATTALVCGVLLLKWRQWALAVYTLASVIVALSSLILQSQARYAMVLFPMFIVLAIAGERPRVDETIRAVSLALLCLMTALFAAHFSIALA